MPAPDTPDALARAAATGDAEAVHAMLLRIQQEHGTPHPEMRSALAHLDDPALWWDILRYLAGEGWRGQHMPIPRYGITHDLHELMIRPFGQSVERRQAVVREAMTGPAVRLRALAATLAAETADRQAVPLAIPLLDDPDPPVQIAAAHVLQAVPVPAAAEALVRNLDAADYGARSAATAALRTLGPVALPALLRRLIERPLTAHGKEAARYALQWVAAGTDPAMVATLAEALTGQAAGVTVPVAADRLLAWCRANRTFAAPAQA